MVAGAGSGGPELAEIKPLLDELGESTRHVLELPDSELSE